MKKSILSLALFSFFIFFNSCQNDEISDNIDNEVLSIEDLNLDNIEIIYLDDDENQEQLTNTPLTENNIELTEDQFQALRNGGISIENRNVVELSGNLFGKEVFGIRADDNFVSYEDLEDLVKDSEPTLNNNSRLPIRRDRVNTPRRGSRRLLVGVATSGTDGLSGRQRNAVLNALNRYNSVGMASLRFGIVIGGSGPIAAQLESGAIDMVVFNDDNGDFVGGFDGFAGFPSGGDPAQLVGLNSRSRRFTNAQLNVLAQHEIGHTIGLVHSDHRDRRSCSNGGPNQDVDPSTIENIPNSSGNGGVFQNSIMTACSFFRFNNFTGEDRRSLRNAYNGRDF